MAHKLPLVVILGATGSGKTKLSLELAKKFGGEIVGADSMQIYKGLDIITAKATPQERSIAPHHLVDFVSPHETFTVVDFRNKAVKIVDDLVTRAKLPIVVGGTNYYIESLLWKILIEEPGSQVDRSKPGTLPNDEHLLPSEDLHKKLKLIDPVMAKRLHPNNKRKILRALEVLSQKGRKLSEILEEQRKSKGGNVFGGGLRYPNSVVLWLQCEQEILDERLNARVDAMLEQGLLQELTNFHQQYSVEKLKTNESLDYTVGIFQSIGLKEFHNYLMLPEIEQKSEVGQKAFQEGVEQLKMVTRRYARKQKKWINNRLLSSSDRQVPPVYGLDATDISAWDENVSQRAMEIVESYICNTPCPHERLPFKQAVSQPNAKDDTYTCETCDRVFVGIFQWNSHLKSNRHKKRLEAVKRNGGIVKNVKQDRLAEENG